MAGGIDSLSTVLQLLNQIEKSGLSDLQNKKFPSIMILEKGREIGAHSLSGAVVDSESLSTLLGDCNRQNTTIESYVSAEKFCS